MDVATRENAKAAQAVEQAHSPTIENLVASVGGEHAFSKVALSKKTQVSQAAADDNVPQIPGVPDLSNFPGAGSQPSIPSLPSTPPTPPQLPDLTKEVDGLVDLIDQNAGVIGGLPAEQKASIKTEIAEFKKVIADIDKSQLPPGVDQFLGANDKILAALERALGN